MGRERSDDLGVNERIILQWMLEKYVWEGVAWIHLVSYRDHWRIHVYTVINLWGP